MKLPPPSGGYNPLQEAQRNRLLETEMAKRYIRGSDVVVPPGEKIVVSDIDMALDQNHTASKGRLYWNDAEETLNIGMDYSVVQQVGMETFARVQNSTGATITKGSVVGFAGVGSSNVLAVSKYLADGVTPTLYILGVMAHDLPDSGQVGYCTVWGHVSGINTSSFSVGDILYASPTTAGVLTKVKPTAPDNVVPLAAVLKVGTTDGEIFVRPTIEQQYYYGQFLRTSTLTPAAANTAYAVAFDTTDSAEGVSLTGSPTTRVTAAHSGLYQFDVRMQFSSANSNLKSGWLWMRKNGTDIAKSAVVGSLKDSSGYLVLYTNDFVSLNANDYVEIMWAVDDTGLQPTTVAATSFAPEAATTHLSVTQVQQ